MSIEVHHEILPSFIPSPSAAPAAAEGTVMADVTEKISDGLLKIMAQTKTDKQPGGWGGGMVSTKEGIQWGGSRKR